MPQFAWPRIVVSRHILPPGPGIRSALRSRAIARGLVPEVERLGENHVERPTFGIPEELPDAGPQRDAGAGDGGILIGPNLGPALAACALAADAKLVLNRGRTLLVGGIACIKRNAGRASSPSEENKGPSRETPSQSDRDI